MLRAFTEAFRRGERNAPPSARDQAHEAPKAASHAEFSASRDLVPVGADGGMNVSEQHRDGGGRRHQEAHPADRLLEGPSTDAIPTTEYRLAPDHAAELLAWLQGAGGRTGLLKATELKRAHSEMCCALDWEMIGWHAVGRELRRLLGDKKLYVRIGGKKVRVYRIPPRAAQRPRLVRAAG